MTSLRLADTDGHLWPYTGRQCPGCRMPSDAVNGPAAFRHASCEADWPTIPATDTCPTCGKPTRRSAAGFRTLCRECSIEETP